MSCYYTIVEQDALLHLQGPAALSFLQGQVTCDTRKLDAHTALPGAYCTAQGRVVCDFLLTMLAEEHLALRMRRDIRASSAAVLGKYIVFSRARLDSEREDWQIIACWGATAARVLEGVFGAVPGGKYRACSGPGFTLVQLDEAAEQFECHLEPARAGSALERLRELATDAGETAWQALQIAAGTARIEASTTGEYIPQMLNYDVTGHISFNKGCYTGQEVVARMHYRGKPKRRLYLAELAAADMQAGAHPVSGDSLYSPGAAQSVGNVINAVASARGGLLMLVTATAAGVDAGLHAASADGPRLHTGQMPYRIPEK